MKPTLQGTLSGLGRVLAMVLLLLLTLALTLPVSAATPAISGSASVWGYMQDDSTEHVQIVPTLSLTVRQLGHKALRFETGLRGYTDVRHGQSEDRSLRLLRATLIYAPQKSPWEARLGQQWLTEGVGRTNLVGLLGRYKLNRETSVTAYGGARLANVISLENRYEEQGDAFGAHIRTRIQPFNVGASYYWLGNDGDVLYSAAGLSASGFLTRGVMARARFEMNLEQSTLERGQLLAEWTATNAIRVTGEFRSITPRIYEDSFFTLFMSEASTEYARLGVRWKFFRDLYVRGTGMMVFAESDNSLYKTQLALGCPSIEAGYTHWLSISDAVMDGVYAQARYRMGEKLEFYGGYDFAKGANADTDFRSAEESSAAYLGAAITPVESFTFSGRAERVDDIRTRDDWRALVAVTARFNNLR